MADSENRDGLNEPVPETMAEPEFVLEDLLKEFHSDEEIPSEPEITETDKPEDIPLPEAASSEGEEKSEVIDEELERSLRIIFGDPSGANARPEKKPKAPFRKSKKAAPPAEENGFSPEIFNEAYDESRSGDRDNGPSPTNTITLRLRKRSRSGDTGGQVDVAEATSHVDGSHSVTEHIDPINLYEHLSHSLKSVSSRLPVAFLLCLPLLYLTLSIPLKLPLPGILTFTSHPFVFVFTEFLLMAAVGLVGLDILANGFFSLFSLRPGGDTLIAVAHLASAVHCAGIIFFPKWGGYLPVCILPALAICFSLLGDYYNLRARVSSLKKVLELEDREFTTMISDEPQKGQRIYLRTRATDRSAYYDGLNHSDPIARIMSWYAPVAVIVPILCAVACAVRTGYYGMFFWAWSMVSGIVPMFGLYVCCALPYWHLTRKCLKYGASVGNCDAVASFSAPGECIVSDGDLFPGGTLKLNGYKMLAPMNKENVLALTAATVSASGSNLDKIFSKILEDECISPLTAENVEFSGHGGIRSEVDGHVVLVGTGAFMQKAGVTLPEGVGSRATVFSAVDMEIAAAFSIRHEYLSRVGNALDILLRGNRKPKIASRDFTLSVSDLEERFEMEEGSLGHLPTEEQVALNNPDRVAPANAVAFTKEDLSAMAAFMEGSRRYARAVRILIVLTMLASAIGGAILCLATVNAWTTVVTPWRMLLFEAALTLPGFLVAAWVSKF